MKRNTTPNKREPSKASLKEIPEVDFSTARVIGRGRHVGKAKRAFPTFETVAIEKSILEALGGREGLNEILQALAKSIGLAKKKRRAA